MLTHESQPWRVHGRRAAYLQLLLRVTYHSTKPWGRRRQDPHVSPSHSNGPLIPKPCAIALSMGGLSVVQGPWPLLALLTLAHAHTHCASMEARGGCHDVRLRTPLVHGGLDPSRRSSASMDAHWCHPALPCTSSMDAKWVCARGSKRQVTKT